QMENGGTTTINSSDVGDANALAVNGQAAPSFDVNIVNYVGTTAQGAGKFIFKMECSANITGATVSVDNNYSTITYQLVEDTYGGYFDVPVSEAARRADHGTVRKKHSESDDAEWLHRFAAFMGVRARSRKAARIHYRDNLCSIS